MHASRHGGWAGMILACSCACASAGLWYVNDATDPGEDGSAAHPFDTIAEAIAAAQPGDEVVVDDGVYAGPGNKDLDLLGKEIVLRSQNGPSNTRIDCEGVGRAFVLQSGETTNTVIRGFRITGANTSVLVEVGSPGPGVYTRIYDTNGSAIVCRQSGFTMEDCVVEQSQAMTYRTDVQVGIPGDSEVVFQTAADGSGGGLFGEACDVVLRNVRFSGCSAGGHGGAVALWSSSTAHLENCTVEANAAGLDHTQRTIRIGWQGSPGTYNETDLVISSGGGGGIFLEHSALVLSNVTVRANAAGLAGGGVYAVSSSVLQVEGGAIEDNYVWSTIPSPAGGGIAVVESEADLRDLVIRRNTCAAREQRSEIQVGIQGVPGAFIAEWRDRRPGRGGGLYLDQATQAVLRAVRFEANAAGAAGGGLCATNVQGLLMTNVVFADNATLDTMDPEAGGGGAALWVQTGDLCHVTFTNNRAGDAWRLEESIVGVEGLPGVFIRQQDVQRSSRGGGLLVTGGQVGLRDHVFADNAAGDGGGMGLAGGTVVNAARGKWLNNQALRERGTDVEVTQVGFPENPVFLVRRKEAQGDVAGSGGAVLVASGRLAAETIEARGNHAGGSGSAVEVLTNATLRLGSGLLVDNQAGREVETTTESLNGTTSTWSVVRHQGAGALSMQTATAELVNVTIAWNQGTPEGAGLRLGSGSMLALRNSIVASNGVFVDAALLTGSYSFVTGGLPGQGNLAADPRITTEGRLWATSPCIDAGLDTDAPPEDFEGESRVDHPAHPNLVSTVDTGADEFVDGDGDALPDAWEVVQFGSTAARDGTADDDHDGLDERGEFEHSVDRQVPDTDGDGMPDGWEVAYLLAPRDADAEQDPDGDSFRNLDEYVAVTSPANGADFFRLADASSSDGAGPQIAWLSQTGRTYEVESSSSLEGGWLEVASGVGDGGVQSFAVSNEVPAEFHRLRVYLNP